MVNLLMGVGIIVLGIVAVMLTRRHRELVAEVHRERLEALNRVRAIASAIGHDMTEPLEGIADAAILLKRRPIDAEARELVDEIVESMMLASERVQGLADYAKGTTDPDSTMSPALEVVNAAARLANGGLEVRSSGDLEVSVPRALINVVANLLTNARRYGLPGQPPIAWVDVAAVPQAVRIQVRDEGRGFEPHHAEDIFRLYRRLYADVPGTGMGLAIVRDMVARLGGSVTAHSDGPGLGATFTLTLPRR